MDQTARGLEPQEAARRLQQYGPNALPEAKPLGWGRRLLAQFRSPLIYVLLFALVLDLLIWLWEQRQGWPIEALAIGAILAVNALLGAWQEYRSESALARLKQLALPQVWVLRGGRLLRCSGQEVVPGDWVRLEAGDRVPADGVLVESGGVLLDESLLSGESVPVDKSAGQSLYSGTLVVRGRGFLQVQLTGVLSTLGALAQSLGQIDAGKSPLELRLERFGRQVAWGVLSLAGLLAVLGVLSEGVNHAAEVLVFAVALAVAAVPEGLPAVLTFTLALGVERMARRKAVVRKLAAVEALGSVTVIATDKTGTLTENRMEVHRLDSPEPDKALLAMVLANDADDLSQAGDPLELGLLRYAQSQGLNPQALHQRYPRQDQRGFDSAWRYMRVTVWQEQGLGSYLKGAWEELLERSDMPLSERHNWSQKALQYSQEGYRVLALACSPGQSEQNLSFLGLVSFWDPPRPEVALAVQQAQEAGIRVLMLTGDHPATAQAVARQIGLEAQQVLSGAELQSLSPSELAQALKKVQVFARVLPEHKLRLVQALQQAGEIVAMTGDGVNDAPALKRSNVGIAMGQRGSDVSREVADLVLLDDNFATLVAAIEEGRSIYENIQKFLRFLLSTNLAEVLVVAVGSAVALAYDWRQVDGSLLLPLTAAQILWINLVTDGLPALALALDRNPQAMRRSPISPNAPLLDAPSLAFVLLAGVVKAVLALGLLWGLPSWGYSFEAARSSVFHFMAIGQLFFTYPSRHTFLLPLSNRWLHGVVGAGVVLQVGVGSVERIAQTLAAQVLPGLLWGVVLVTALLSWILAEALSRAVWFRQGRYPSTKVGPRG